jgi:hypothetical protein
MTVRLRGTFWIGILALFAMCAKSPPPATFDAGAGVDQTAPATTRGTLTISATTRNTGALTAVGLNYWSWTYGSNLSGTEDAVHSLTPAILRIGGHNNDWNSPSPFNDSEMDRAVAYARAVGAEPIIQVPILDDIAGATPTAATAAGMVTYANITKSYGVKYFSIGNEPDLYADPAQTPNVPGYTAASYCRDVKAFVPAMRAVDPSIKILGPELSWKYQSGANDWLTPILTDCGEHFDIVSVHRYPIDPARTTSAASAIDADQFKGMIAATRQKMTATGHGAKPLALTETNLTWNGDPAVSTLEASPGTLPAGLWTADTLGVGLTEGLWTTAFWSIREGWTLGLLSPASVKRPAYFAFSLYADHFGPTRIAVTAAPSGVHAYASRNGADDRTQAIVVNWSAATQILTIDIVGLPTAVPATTVSLAPMTMTAVEITDAGALSAWSYGAKELEDGVGPRTMNP